MNFPLNGNEQTEPFIAVEAIDFGTVVQTAIAPITGKTVITKARPIKEVKLDDWKIYG